MRKVLAMLVTSLVVLGVGGDTATGAGAAPYCGLVWGSLPESAGEFTSAPVTNLRTGRHACFDRLVIDLGPKVPGLPGPDVLGYDVRYVPQVLEDGSGDPVTLAGSAFLAIVVRANAFDEGGNPTFSPADRLHAVNVAGYRTFRQVAFLGTFEGYTTIGLGVRARLPFRTFVLAGPGEGSRLVIDVAHRW